MVFGDWLAAKMTKSGLTQTDIAAAAGVRQQAVSRWILNKGTPDAIRLRPLARKLDVSVDEVLDQLELSLPLPPEDGLTPEEDDAAIRQRIAQASRLMDEVAELRSRRH